MYQDLAQNDWGAFTSERSLRVGTDCSGMDAPIVALQQLKIPFSHEFSSEIDQHCVATIRANFAPKVLFGDMTKRRIQDIPDIDLYVCGFPCQPFSMIGKRKGVEDPRGTLFWECLRVIRNKKPMVFVLENVRGLLSIDRGNTFRNIMNALESMQTYRTDWKILNTCDYGIPQSRKRIFIVGIRKDMCRRPLQWPRPVTCAPLEHFVDWRDEGNVKTLPHFVQGTAVFHATQRSVVFVNLSDKHNAHVNADVLCPCLLTCAHNYYCVPMKRYMTPTEMRWLQGFPAGFVDPNSKSRSQQLIANTMSVNVLVFLFKSIAQTLRSDPDED